MWKSYVKYFIWLTLIGLLFFIVYNNESSKKITIQKNFLVTELLDACRQGNLEQVRKLIKQGANVNGVYVPPNLCSKGEDGCYGPISQTPLLAARNWEIVKELINAGANVNQKNSEGETPLMFASMAGDIERVKVLLSAGANVNAISSSYTDYTGPQRYTALVIASQYGYTDVVKTLIAAGADVNKGRGRALQTAKQKGYTEIVKLLKAAGAKE